MPENSSLKKEQPIIFENGNQADLIQVTPGTDAAEILSTLGISQAQAIILVCGSTQPLSGKHKNRLQDLLSRGVAQAAADSKAVIIDGGTNAGVIELMGQGVDDRDRVTKLLGVAPKGKVTVPKSSHPEDDKDRTDLDPNHTHFVLVESEKWGGETKMMFELAKSAAVDEKSILTILVGGGLEGVSLEEALATVRQGWPLVVLEGSGRLADKIARLWKRKASVEKRTGRLWKLLNQIPGLSGLLAFRIDDPHLAEVIYDGNIIVFPQKEDAVQLRDAIKNLIAPPAAPHEDLLWLAWKRFAEYDQNSTRHRDNWYKLKNVPLILGVLSTLLVLIYSSSGAQISIDGQNILWVNAYNSFMGWLNGIQTQPVLDLIFRFLIILLPITTSIILGVETRFKLGSKYILLRGAAEAVKRGIYSYRTLNKIKAPPDHLPSSEADLADHIEKVSKILLDSDVKEAAFKAYHGSIPPRMYGAAAGDNGRSDLTPGEYIKIRIGDQIEFFTLRTNQYEHRLRRLQIWILVLGGFGTFLAAVGAQYWIPLTAVIVSSITAFLEYRQIETTLVKYNLTKTSLENIRNWWQALPSAQKNDENIYRLVREVEAILESENQGWVQYVKQAQETQKGTISEE